MTGTILTVREVTRRFGGVQALRSVSFDVQQGEILGMLGANGSGKTTLLSIICGARRPSSGEICFEGRDVTGRPSELLVARGIVRTFQQSMTFPRLSVADNVRIVTSDIERAEVLLARLGLGRYWTTAAGSLPHGAQRMLGVTLALLTGPRLLMLDEPAAGLSAGDAETLAVTLKEFRDNGLTIVVVEHDMSFVLPLTDRVVVLNAGEVIFTGEPGMMRLDPHVRDAYLGPAT